MREILFQCEKRTAFWGDELICYLRVYSDGKVEVWHKADRKDLFDPVGNIYKCVSDPQIADQVENILQRRKAAINALPDSTHNGTFDGCQDSFCFRDKKVVTWNIARHNLKSLEAKIHTLSQKANDAGSIEWMEKIKKGMQHENMICDIYNEIAKVINENAPVFQLPIL